MSYHLTWLVVGCLILSLIHFTLVGCLSKKLAAFTFSLRLQVYSFYCSTFSSALSLRHYRPLIHCPELTINRQSSAYRLALSLISHCPACNICCLGSTSSVSNQPSTHCVRRPGECTSCARLSLAFLASAQRPLSKNQAQWVRAVTRFGTGTEAGVLC